MQQVKIDDQVADSLTNRLNSGKYEKFRRQLNMFQVKANVKEEYQKSTLAHLKLKSSSITFKHISCDMQ